MKAITGKQRRYLRGEGHGLSPVVQIVSSPPTQSVIDEVDRQLNVHELIKVKLAVDERGERREAARYLAEKLSADLVQEVGKTVLLFRPNTDKKNPIRLPSE